MRALAVEALGAVLGQAFGLGVFTVAVMSSSAGHVDFASGILGYGTVLFSPFSGVGAWIFGRAFCGPSMHKGRALVASCALAIGCVAAFFGIAAVFRFDGVGWMVPYALSPVIGAVCGYHLGSRGIVFPRPELKGEGD